MPDLPESMMRPCNLDLEDEDDDCLTYVRFVPAPDDSGWDDDDA